MQFSTKELRVHTGKVIERAVNGDEVIITYRGKALAKLVSLEQNLCKDTEMSAFGMWGDDYKKTENIEAFVRDIRKGRVF